MFDLVNPVELVKAVQNWLCGMSEAGGQAVHIDGKTVRGSENGERKREGEREQLDHWAGATEEKSNEITAIPELLNLIYVRGDTVTVYVSETEFLRVVRRR